MKKLLLTATLLTTTGVMMAATSADAKEVSNATTGAGIQFDFEGPTDPGEGPFKDNLAIVWKPSKFDFGKHKALGNAATYNNIVVGDQYLVVNDDRKGTDVVDPEPEAKATETSAWKLTGQMSDLVSVDGATLPATLSFGLGEVQKYDIGNVIDPDTNDYVPNPVDESSLSDLTGSNNIVFTKNVNMEAGATTDVEIMGKTKADSMTGGFATLLKDTKLAVVSSEGAAGKNFKGTVTWSLNDTY